MTGTTPIPTDPYTGQPWQPTEAAAEGAALLDRLPWPRWRELVDPDRLDMSDGTYFGKVECAACVGAQLDHHQLTADLGGEAQGEWTGFLAVVFPALHDPHPLGLRSTSRSTTGSGCRRAKTSTTR